MSALAYLRHPITLLAAVCIIIGAFWYLLGLPSQMPPSPFSAGERLACAAYAPELPGEISAARVEADLKRIASVAGCVRTFRTGRGMDRVPAVADSLGLRVLQGIELGSDAAANRSEIERAVAAARTHPKAIRAFVAGTDTVSRRTMRATDLASVVRQVRERTSLPVTSSEQVAAWLEADALAAAVDFIILGVPLYDAYYPVPARHAAATVLAARSSVASAFPGKPVLMVETGWPSAGRMRDGAFPSPSHQARVLHELAAASKRAKFQLSVFEAIDQPERARNLGTAAAHWGLIEADAAEAKFEWGGAVVDHPLWFMQAAAGVLFALIVFAAAFLSARSAGPKAPATAHWLPVALIALVSAPLLGWAIADLPVQSRSIGTWTYGAALLIAAMAIPPICAAAAVRAVQLPGFTLLLDPVSRNASLPLARTAAVALTMFALLAIPLGLLLAVDPQQRDIPFASMIGPALALTVLSLSASRRPAARDEGIGEAAAAVVLGSSAILIVFSESFWNWQAVLAATALLALALVCWRARAVQTPGQ